MESIKSINKKYTYPREGDSGMIDTHLVMKMFRCGFKSIGGIKVERVLDHSKEAAGSQEEAREAFSEDGHVKGGIEYRLSDGSSVEIRASGIEPKLEVHILIAGDDAESALELEKRIREDIESIIYMDNRMGYCCE